MGAPMPRCASPSSPAGHGSARRAKQAPPMPCRSASPFLVPARHSFALRVPARLSLRLFQAFPIAAQSTATDVPRLLLHSKRNRKIPPPPRKFRGLGSRPDPCHPSVRGPVPAALSISFRLQKAYNTDTDAAMVAKLPLRDGAIQTFHPSANYGFSMVVLYLQWHKMSICTVLFNDWFSRK